uniref:Ig-like domain-containing protein n=1 Tax=Phocoena sinus TaxID=42100 RepID=A0A8C9C4H2_PHOSS
MQINSKEACVYLVPGLSLNFKAVLSPALWYRSCWGQITLTQTPETLAASQGSFVSITCKSSMEVGTSMAWYQKKPKEPPRLLIFGASARASGTPSRFQGSGSGFDFSLAIHGVEAEDVGVYYCQWQIMENFPPSVFLFHPSEQQLETGTASVVCLVNSFYPKTIKVSWKVDGVVQASNIQESFTEQDSKDSTYSLSSTLTLSRSEYESHSLYTCEVSHQSLASALVKSINKDEC